MAGLRLSASPASRSLNRASSGATAGAGAAFVGASAARTGAPSTARNPTRSRTSRTGVRALRIQNLLVTSETSIARLQTPPCTEHGERDHPLSDAVRASG